MKRRALMVSPMLGAMIGAVHPSFGASERRNISPSPAKKPVINPGKGWISYGDFAKKDAVELALASVGYMRFEWQMIQPVSKGLFDWRGIDDFISSWASAGKQVAFGVMAANSHSQGDGRGYVTPKWVFDGGVPGRNSSIRDSSDVMQGQPGLRITPSDYENAVFLAYLENFVAAMAARYDGDRRIAFVDIRSYENWGEGFSRAHVLLHKKYFKKTMLCQSSEKIQFTPWLAAEGVAVRRDGIGGSRGEELAPAAGLVPAIFEFWGDINYLKKRGWWNEGNLLPTAIEIGAPTFVEMPRPTDLFLREYSGLIQSETNRIGFNFQIRKIDWNPRVVLKKRSEVVDFFRASFFNSGVSRIFFEAHLFLALLNEDGSVFSKMLISQAKLKDWMSRAEYAISVDFNFEKVKPGRFYLGLGIFFRESDASPTYLFDTDLPLKNKWAIAGVVNCE